MKRILVALVLIGCGSGDRFEVATDAGPVSVADNPVPDGGPAAGGRLGISAGGAASAGGRSSTGGTGTGGVTGCALVTHDNGAGQTWQDCVPLGTWNEAQAMKACLAHTNNSRECVIGIGCGAGNGAVQGTDDADVTYVWGYSGQVAGYVQHGGVCPTSAGKDWN